MKKAKLLYVLFFLQSSFCKAQSFIPQDQSVPLGTDQYTQVLPWINPSLNELQKGACASLLSQLHPGIWYKNKLTLFSFHYTTGKIAQDTVQGRHAFGLLLYNDSEGKFIDRNRGYFNYSLTLKISPKFLLSTGFAFGVSSIVIDNIIVNTGGSSSVPDGSVGLSIRSSNITAAFSIAQIFGGALKPLYYETSLKSYSNFFIEYSTNKNSRVILSGNYYLRYIPNTWAEHRMGLKASISHLSLQLGNCYKSHVFFGIGFANIGLGNASISSYVSYSVPYAVQITSGFHNIEFNLQGNIPLGKINPKN